MAKNLVIVESPAKGKTIKKYLGRDYEVMASYGHVRDLVPKNGAVEPEQGFRMSYQAIDRNEKHVQAITKALKRADRLVLATDPDREGEAISWHLTELLRERKALDGKPVDRVVFHEITQGALQSAIEQPRDISMELVNAQQARRGLDYLVGFNLSPLLWKKIRRGLSAGRVQTPALRMITEREDEIEAFVPREYWSVEADLHKDDEPFAAKLVRLDGAKFQQFTITDGETAEAARARLVEAATQGDGERKLWVRSVDKKQRKRNPAPPFTTSTLQQEAVRKLGFSASRTMRVAQQLYEGIDTGDGAVGLITYMRTDSVTLAEDALANLRGFIGAHYGADNLPDAPRRYRTKSRNAQEAHEAVRPTDAGRLPSALRRALTSDQYRLYDLIWKRTVACQMIHATLDTVAAELAAGDAHTFRANGSVVRHPGFMAVYREDRDDSKSDPDAERRLPELVEGEHLPLDAIRLDQHFTEPPPRFTEASLVKALEEYGIGRPSTYAAIISTLQDREYVEMEGRRFVPTDVGRVVARFLSEHFAAYVDYEFTARLEGELDAVARGEEDWVPVLDRFWEPLKERITEKEASVSREEAVQSRELGADPESGRPISARMGRYGPLVQMGTRDDEIKPRFAGLRPGQKLDTITFEEALALFDLPRDLGETGEGEPMQANIGRFGPYVRWAAPDNRYRYVSLRGDDDPYTVTPERARELVAEKKIADANRIINTFETDEGTTVQVLNGRFGPYITDGSKNASVPKSEEPAALGLDRCLEVLAAAPERRRGKKKAAAKKTAAKKTAAKKTAAKKKASKKKSAAKKAASKKTASKKKAAAKKKATSKKVAGKRPATKKKAAASKRSARGGAANRPTAEPTPE